MSAPVRLAHRVSELFGCSRAEAEQFIRNGWVTVEGDVVEAPQHKVTVERVELDAEARLEAVEPATILLHKPAGFDAIEGRSPASVLVRPDTRWESNGVRFTFPTSIRGTLARSSSELAEGHTPLHQ